MYRDAPSQPTSSKVLRFAPRTSVRLVLMLFAAAPLLFGGVAGSVLALTQAVVYGNLLYGALGVLPVLLAPLVVAWIMSINTVTLTEDTLTHKTLVGTRRVAWRDIASGAWMDGVIATPRRIAVKVLEIRGHSGDAVLVGPRQSDRALDAIEWALAQARAERFEDIAAKVRAEGRRPPLLGGVLVYLALSLALLAPVAYLAVPRAASRALVRRAHATFDPAARLQAIDVALESRFIDRYDRCDLHRLALRTEDELDRADAVRARCETFQALGCHRVGMPPECEDR